MMATMMATDGGSISNSRISVLQLVLPGITRPRLAGLLFLAVGAMVAGIRVYYHYANQTHGDAAVTVLDVGQAFILLLVTAFVSQFDIARESKCPDARAAQAVEQFRRYWAMLWVLWLGLYLLWSAKGIFVLYRPEVLKDSHWGIPMRIITGIGNLFNNAQSFCFFCLFWIMSRPSLRGGAERNGIPIAPVVALMLVMTTAETLLVALLPGDGSPQPSVDVSPAEWASIAFSGVSGLLAATSMGVFLGRLESSFLRGSLGVIAFLYVYVAIQPLFPCFRIADMTIPTADREAIQPIYYTLKSIALLLKVVLYLHVRDRIVTGRMMFFFDRVRQHTEHAESEWHRYERETFV